MSSTDLLNEAIDNASASRLRTILKSLCSESDSVRTSVCNVLLLPNYSQTNNLSTTGKRKQPAEEYTTLRFATCSRCSTEFDVTENGPQSCKWHEGWLTPIDDFWVDTEEETHGPINSEENHKEFPEGFFWSCCEANGDEEDSECREGPHEVGVSKKVRRW